MMLFRSLTVGMLGACLYFVVQLPGLREVARPQAPATVRTIPPTVIDVAYGVSALTVPSLVHLEPGEHITAVDDREVANDLMAGAVISERARAGTFVDLTVAAGPRDLAARRILVLMH
jgi:hypothetical protein